MTGQPVPQAVVMEKSGIQHLLESQQATLAALQQLIVQLGKPKRIVRDANGRVLGVE